MLLVMFSSMNITKTKMQTYSVSEDLNQFFAHLVQKAEEGLENKHGRSITHKYSLMLVRSQVLKLTLQ